MFSYTVPIDKLDINAVKSSLVILWGHASSWHSKAAPSLVADWTPLKQHAEHTMSCSDTSIVIINHKNNMTLFIGYFHDIVCSPGLAQRSLEQIPVSFWRPGQAGLHLAMASRLVKRMSGLRCRSTRRSCKSHNVIASSVVPE